MKEVIDVERGELVAWAKQLAADHALNCARVAEQDRDIELQKPAAEVVLDGGAALGATVQTEIVNKEPEDKSAKRAKSEAQRPCQACDP